MAEPKKPKVLDPNKPGKFRVHVTHVIAAVYDIDANNITDATFLVFNGLGSFEKTKQDIENNGFEWIAQIRPSLWGVEKLEDKV